MGKTTRVSLGAVLVTGAALLMVPAAMASSTLFFEDWESSVIGSVGTDYCAVNPTTTWTCYGSLQANEMRTASVCGAGHGLETKCLIIAAASDQFTPASAPSMGNSWNAPTGNSTVFAEFNLANAQDASSGNFALYRLTDVNGNEVLSLSFRDANAKLDITNGSGVEEINYDSPNAFRKYQVDLDALGGTYDLTISTIGGTQEYQKLDIPYLSSSNGKPALIRIGSLSNNDASVQGFWDWIKVTG